MNITIFRTDVARWGLTKSIYMRVMRRLERLLRFRLFVIHARLLDPNAPHDVIPADCSVRALEQEEIEQFARNPELGMTSDFVSNACARGDLCFGYLERGVLVAYVWIGLQSTSAEDGMWVEFGPGHSYGYKALTLASHRGRHLQERLVHLSDRTLTSRGYLYNIDYIHTLNFPSIVADRRYGNRPIGYAGYLNWFGRTIPFRTPGVKARGFRFTHPPPVDGVPR